jgi:hypothetical protein
VWCVSTACQLWGHVPPMHAQSFLMIPLLLPGSSSSGCIWPVRRRKKWAMGALWNVLQGSSSIACELHSWQLPPQHCWNLVSGSRSLNCFWPQSCSWEQGQADFPAGNHESMYLLSFPASTPHPGEAESLSTQADSPNTSTWEYHRTGGRVWNDPGVSGLEMKTPKWAHMWQYTDGWKHHTNAHIFLFCQLRGPRSSNPKATSVPSHQIMDSNSLLQ